MGEVSVRFVRHAKGSHMVAAELIAGRSIDAEVTEEGAQQATVKGHELTARGIAIDRVVSSTAVRCVQTGRLILQAMGLQTAIEQSEQLLEMDQGDFVGRVRAEVYTASVQEQIALQGKDFALPGGESMNQVGRRGLQWLHSQALHAPDDETPILAIAHAGLITHTVGMIEGWDQPRSLAMLRSMPPVGETLVAFDGQTWQVDYFAQPVQDV